MEREIDGKMPRVVGRELEAIDFDEEEDFVLIEGNIHLPGIPRYMYKRKILWEIGGMVGKVAKLDFNTDIRVRGRFARMAIYVNLDKPLVSQVLINGVLQRIEYEYLPIVCFFMWPLRTCKGNLSKGFSHPSASDEGNSNALETLMEKYGHQWERIWLEVVLGRNGAGPLKGTKTFESERVVKKNGQVNDMSQGNHAGGRGSKGKSKEG
ncbi:hypothetical protein Goshw_024710 [Gossypium schwendimanii]|uniref:DUF4283 domain-containing protein n=1 Tax=Gossypium schwendimanii TaxID=34291 RepID=A0A7J9L5Q0_GOSSC|nr:hypothetical protein [Gossypium schwendimanii]